MVKSSDKQFAYDIFNGRMIEYPLGNRDLNVEIENNVVTLFFDQRLRPDLIEPNLKRLIALRQQFPEYLVA